jgi:hypothetical protein
MRWVPLALVAVAALWVAGCETFDPKHPLVGKPTDFEGAPAVYVWIADGLWHVRLHSGGKGGHRFQGSVAGVTGGVLDLTLTRPELKDAIALAGDAVQFDVEEASLTTAPATSDKPYSDAGFDVRVVGGCARFDLYVDGHHHTDKVRLGPKLMRPVRVPFDRCP